MSFRQPSQDSRFHFPHHERTKHCRAPLIAVRPFVYSQRFPELGQELCTERSRVTTCMLGSHIAQYQWSRQFSSSPLAFPVHSPKTIRDPAPSSTLLAGAQRGEPNAAAHPCAVAFPPSDRFRLSLTQVLHGHVWCCGTKPISIICGGPWGRRRVSRMRAWGTPLSQTSDCDVQHRYGWAGQHRKRKEKTLGVTN